MLHHVTLRHTAESCPGRPGNEHVIPCVQKLDDVLRDKGIRVVARYADPPGHVNFYVVDAENAHAIVDAIMESGLVAHTTSEIRAVLSMDG